MSTKANKKRIRERFRSAVFARDAHRCVLCSSPAVDAHHITDRSELPSGGYVRSNGISLCAACHMLAEVYHSTGSAHPGYSPDDLYARIGSSYEQARADSESLSRKQ